MLGEKVQHNLHTSEETKIKQDNKNKSVVSWLANSFKFEVVFYNIVKLSAKLCQI